MIVFRLTSSIFPLEKTFKENYQLYFYGKLKPVRLQSVHVESTERSFIEVTELVVGEDVFVREGDPHVVHLGQETDLHLSGKTRLGPRGTAPDTSLALPGLEQQEDLAEVGEGGLELGLAALKHFYNKIGEIERLSRSSSSR